MGGGYHTYFVNSGSEANRGRSRVGLDDGRIDAAAGAIVAWCAGQRHEAGGIADPGEIPLRAGKHPSKLAVQRRAALRAVGEQHPQRHTGEPRLRRRRQTPPPDRRDRTRLDNWPEATIRLTADRPRSDPYPIALL